MISLYLERKFNFSDYRASCLKLNAMTIGHVTKIYFPSMLHFKGGCLRLSIKSSLFSNSSSVSALLEPALKFLHNLSGLSSPIKFPPDSLSSRLRLKQNSILDFIQSTTSLTLAKVLSLLKSMSSLAISGSINIV